MPEGVLEDVTKEESLYCSWKGELTRLPGGVACTSSREKMETTPDV